ERVHVVRPSASSLVSPDATHLETRIECEKIPVGFRVLLLSTYNPNKNIELLPEIAKVLTEEYGDSCTVFLITLPPDASSTNKILRKAREFGVGSRIYNIGPVAQEGCAEVYRACDAVILPS